ncbi:MAG: hypothetical protein ABWX67_03440 [Allosphingosinicella sp.]
MTLVKIGRLLAGALLTTSMCAISIPAQAQAPRPAAGVRLPCCRCLDGTSTSADVSTGTAAWSVAFGSGAAQPVVPASNVSWTPVPPGKWVGPAGNSAIGDYSYTMPFQVPKCVIPMQVTISGKFAADNVGKLYIDGNFVKASQGTANYGFLPGSVTPFSWTGVLTPGAHAIKMVVTNTSGPTGVVVAATITVTCPREIEQ